MARIILPEEEQEVAIGYKNLKGCKNKKVVCLKSCCSCRIVTHLLAVSILLVVLAFFVTIYKGFTHWEINPSVAKPESQLSAIVKLTTERPTNILEDWQAFLNGSSSATLKAPLLKKSNAFLVDSQRFMYLQVPTEQGAPCTVVISNRDAFKCDCSYCPHETGYCKQRISLPVLSEFYRRLPHNFRVSRDLYSLDLDFIVDHCKNHEVIPVRQVKNFPENMYFVLYTDSDKKVNATAVSSEEHI